MSVSEGFAVLWAPSFGLPLDIISFTGRQENGGEVILDWETALEINIDHYIVERSTDGKLFEKIGMTEAVSEYYKYSFEDHHAIVGLNYYRLRIVSSDSKSSYSAPIQVKVSARSFRLVGIYPLPTSGEVNITYVTGSKEPLTMDVVDILGEEVFQEVIAPNIGLNRSVLDLSDLAIGVYFLKFGSKDRTHIITKVIKQ